MNDPIVEEVRAIRRQIFEECGNDLKRLFDRFKAAEAQDMDRLVTLEHVQDRARDGVWDGRS
jgi:hypothetical protein